MKVGNFNIRAKDQLIVNFHALHHNPLEWQRPDEFLPKRFDPKDPLFLTPKGQKRHNYSFVPFNGGQRACFGKTFAETSMKMIAIYTTQLFDMEIIGDEYKAANAYPMSHMAMSKPGGIKFRFTLAK